MSNTNFDPSLNATRHAAAAERLFIHGENPEDFKSLLDDLFAQYQPAHTQAASFVADFARARWVFDRRQRIHADFEVYLSNEAPESLPVEDINKLNLFDRYLTQAHLRLRRALANLQSIRKEEREDEKWRELLVLQKQKLALEIQRFEFQQAKHAPKAQQQKEEECSKQKAADLAQAVADYQDTLKPLQTDPELGPVLVQHSFISAEDGVTIIDEIIPPHRMLRKYIDEREKYPNPPTLVVRYFTFRDNIPPEYEFLIEAGLERTNEDRRYIRLNLNFDAYLKLADQEDIHIATQPEVQ